MSSPSSKITTGYEQGGNSAMDSTLNAKMANLQVAAFPKRPGLGTLGRQVTTLVNHFQMDLQTLPVLGEYIIKLKSKSKSDEQITGRMRARIISLLLNKPDFSTAASDYRNKLISTKNLGGEVSHIIDYYEVEEDGPRRGDRQLTFCVALKLAEKYIPQDLLNHARGQSNRYQLLERHLAAINIVLARGPAEDTTMATTARREKFFKIDDADGHRDLGNGLVVMSGFTRSARLTMNGLTVNLNTAASVMYQPGPLDKLIDLFTASVGWSPKHLNALLKFLRVETSYSGRRVRRTITHIPRPVGNNAATMPTSDNISFTKNGTQISVLQHFRTTYPNLRRTNEKSIVVNFGTSKDPIYIPSDLCEVLPGQPYKTMLKDAKQSANMINFACRRPGVNQQLILEKGLRQMGVGVTGGLEERFGLNISTKMMMVNARLLPKMSFSYKSKRDDKIGTGSWNMAGKVFKVSAPETMMRLSWLELYYDEKHRILDAPDFTKRMQQALRQYTGLNNIQIQTNSTFEHSRKISRSPSFGELQIVFDVLKKAGIKLVFVVLPDKSAQVYRTVKVCADYLCGIHTVCTVRDGRTHRLKVDDGCLANESLKVNQKLGGVNLTLDVPPLLKGMLSEKRMMLIGADVVHPGRDAMKFAPSVAAVAATFDGNFFHYVGSYSLQQPDDATKKAVEFIKNFGDMCEERLRFFQEKNKNTLPNLIVVYRDGVADNMFAEVVNTEMMQLQKTYQKLYDRNKQPETIFMVVKKRGHTRFFQPETGHHPAFDSNGNPRPGFIVDGGVASGKLWDWFLVSHQCIKGTSRPAHYVVLHNDSKATTDQLQLMTYAMCFLWGRATKSIGIHPIARAADKMCDRAKIYLEDVYHPPPSEDGQEKPVYNPREDHWPGKVHGDLCNSMFYI